MMHIKKNYKIINITILCICIYLLCFPLISILLESVNPSLTKCAYLSLTNKPCPLCGGTRFLKNITNVFYDITYIFNFFGLLIFIVILEIIFRATNIIKNRNSIMLIRLDIILHGFILVFYFIYEILFIIYT